jgi:hypothetical protein
MPKSSNIQKDKCSLTIRRCPRPDRRIALVIDYCFGKGARTLDVRHDSIRLDARRTCEYQRTTTQDRDRKTTSIAQTRHPSTDINKGRLSYSKQSRSPNQSDEFNHSTPHSTGSATPPPSCYPQTPSPPLSATRLHSSSQKAHTPSTTPQYPPQSTALPSRSRY